jgi:hypothetical protein
MELSALSVTTKGNTLQLHDDTPLQPPSKHTEFPKMLYYQGAADIPSKKVKNQAEQDALGAEWGPWPFTLEVVDRSIQPEIPGMNVTNEPQGTEFPCYFYHQRNKNVKEKIVADPIAAERLGKDWGPMPYSDERFALLQELDAREAELKAVQQPTAPADPAPAPPAPAAPAAEAPVPPVPAPTPAATAPIPPTPEAPAAKVKPLAPPVLPPVKK